MYVLALIMSLSGNASNNEIIGAYSHLEQCENASLEYTSKTKCYYLDPQKGMMDVNAVENPHKSKK